MTDQETAAYLTENHWTELNDVERSICDKVYDCVPLKTPEQRRFDSLKVHFEDALSNVAEVPACRETPDDEGGGLL